jgi:putative hydrolase of the HAD superfamily
MDPWVIFDADNTLWEVESLYDDARRNLSSMLAARGADETLVGNIQQAIDEELYKMLGYSAERFPASFDRTLLHFFPTASEDDRAQIRSLAEKVFIQPAIVHVALADLVNHLSPHYKLGILTAGEAWVQQGRLDQFIHRHHFTTEIVPHKDVGAFEQFIVKYDVDRARSWMVGDSLRSDIIPAHAVGLKCILLQSHNWHRVEMEQMTIPAYVRRVNDLSEILRVIPTPSSS